MSEEKKTPNTTPDDMQQTQEVIPERLIRSAQSVHTGAGGGKLVIPEGAQHSSRPTRRFIRSAAPEFVSTKKEADAPEELTALEKYTDRLDAAAFSAPPAEPTAPAAPEPAYDTVHAPAGGERMITAAGPGGQLKMEGLNAAEAQPEPEAEDDMKIAEPSAFSAEEKPAPGTPTRPFDVRGDRLVEIAGTANDDVRRNPDQLMMAGFEKVGQKTEEEIAGEEKLKEELQTARDNRVKSFRFWDKAPEKETGEAPADEKYTSTKKVLALPAFAARFAERFAHIPTRFTPVNAPEHTDTTSRKVVFDAIKQGRTRSTAVLCALSAIALILLITDIAAKLTAAANNGFITVFGGSANALAAFNLVFLVLACGLLLPDLKNGVVTVLKLRPKTEALILLLMLSALAQTIGIFITQSRVAFDFQPLAPAAVLVCVPYMLSKLFYYDNARQVFKTVSVKSDKSYLRRVTDPELRSRLCVNEGQNAVYVGRTRAVGGFPASAETGGRGEMPASRICAALAALSLLTALIVLIAKRSLMGGLSALTLCLALSLPVCSLSAEAFFLSRANGKLSLKSSFIQTYADAKAFSVIDTVCCEAAELFDAEIVSCITAKDVSEKQVRFAAAAAAAGAGSMIRKVFAPEIETYAEKLPPAKNVVYEDKMGVSAYVSGCTVLLGNHDMMLNHNVAVPDENLIGKHLKEGQKPLYLAMEGRFTALFGVNYSAPEDVKQGIRSLVNGGAALLLSTTDPNVSDAAAEEVLGLPENSVRMMVSSAAKKLSAARSAVSDSEEVGVVFGDSFLSLARAALQAVRLDALKTVTNGVCIGGAFVTLAVGMLLSFTGAFISTTAVMVLVLQALLLTLCFLGPLYTQTVMNTGRRLTAAREKRAEKRAAAQAAEEAAGEETELFGEEASDPAADALLSETPEEEDYRAPSIVAAESGADAPQTPADEAAEEAEAEPEPEAEAADEDPFAMPARKPAPADAHDTMGSFAIPEKKDASEAAPDPFDEFLRLGKEPETPEQKEAMLLHSLNMFAPKEEAPQAPQQDEAPEEDPGRFIASKSLKDTFSSVDSFLSALAADRPDAPDESEPDISLFGKDAFPQRRSGREIEEAYERRKADEAAVRLAFTAPEQPKAPLFDLRRRRPEPKAEKAPEPQLDTSDVYLYNDDLFRRFENDDDVFSGLKEEERPDIQF